MFFFVSINCDGSPMVSECVLGREASPKPFRIIIKWFPKTFEHRFFGLRIRFFFQNSQRFITKTWFSRVFKSNRLFSYGCSGQTKLGEGQGGHKSKICRYDFHLKAYFLKKWNFCSPEVLEKLENLKNHRISNQKKIQKSRKCFFS